MTQPINFIEIIVQTFQQQTWLWLALILIIVLKSWPSKKNSQHNRRFDSGRPIKRFFISSIFLVIAVLMLLAVLKASVGQ